MKVMKSLWRNLARLGLIKDERGSALIIVTLILALLTVYISASLMTATTDAISSNFAVAQQRAFFTAYSKIEQMTGDFSNLFLTSLSPSYDSMCRVVISNPTNMNGFDLAIPNVNCPNSGPCTPNYSNKFMAGTNLFDLGWEGDPIPNNGYCIVDVCNPNAGPICNFPIRPTNAVQIQKGDFVGLQGFARRFRMVSTATNASLGGADIQITRDFNNYLLPVFQFGIFTDTDFELLLPPPWTFGGWVHTNGDFYATGNESNNITRNVFSQYGFDANGAFVRRPGRITVAKHMVIGTDKSGDSVANSFIRVYKTDTTFDDISVGTARNGANVANCNQIANPSLESPPGTCNPSFNGTSAGTVKTGVRPLKLPIQNLLGANPIEIIKRGLPADLNPGLSSPMLSARFYYKPGIRVTMADYQTQLPRQVQSGDSPAEGTGAYGGIQLDGPDPYLGMNIGSASNPVVASANQNWFYENDGTGRRWPIPRGYQPKVKDPTSGVARASGARVNGYRVHGWIKVELVKADGRTFDITEEFLNLGVTVPYQANTGSAFYYPRGNSQVNFPATLPLAQTSNGPYPDENSVLHLQRMGVPYNNNVSTGGTTLPATISNPAMDSLTNVVRFDYYASMSLRRYNDSTVAMFGIEDNADTINNSAATPTVAHATYTTKYVGNSLTGAGNSPYAEPQPDPGGYYTDSVRVTAPRSSPIKTEIDFTGNMATNRPAAEGNNKYPRIASFNGGFPLSENVNLPKAKGDPIIAPESSWSLRDSGGTVRHLVPFPVNMFDAREGTPHEPRSGATADPPVPGMGVTNSPSKNGTINLIEIDMGNLGRLLKGDFDRLFSQMGTTPYTMTAGGPLRAVDLQDNIIINQDSGWILYVSDRRGDEPRLRSNPNLKTPLTQYEVAPTMNKPESFIGDGEYNREDVVWSQGGNTGGGNAAAIPVQTRSNFEQFGCKAGNPVETDNQDIGKSPQDSNNDCFIQSEENSGQYSETAPFRDVLTNDQINHNYPGLSFNPVLNPGTSRHGVGLALTQVPTVDKQSWSHKPPVVYRDSTNDLHVEMFRRGIRLVNASNIFPTGPQASSCGGLLGVTLATENPVYVFGNFNAPAGENIDTDSYPGINGNPPSLSTAGVPTSLGNYNGQNFANCGNNCHVPTSIIADAVTLLSSACVGTLNTNWSTANGSAGWLDTRSFMSPYQAIANRPARDTVYRFATITGYTPSWYPTYWGNTSINQGPTNAGGKVGYDASSGGLNNFPRFLEDWGQNGSGNQFAFYGGSLIRLFKSRQANGATKRILSHGTVGNGPEYVYVPPNRDWVFDLDFSRPCTLPPGAPFLQLIDFKGFQESVQQQR